MGLKSIELQVALPRTQELGKIQEQQNQRGMINQQLNTEEEKLRAALERQKTTETEGMQHRRVSDEEHQKEQNRKKRNQKGNKKHDPQDSVHPFKGRHIDLSL